MRLVIWSLSMIKVDRPKAGVDRINHETDFENCYLRHQYLRRAKYNPTKSEMDPYYRIVHNFASNTFYVYKNLFILVGLDLEDVINIAQVQLVSFLGSFSLECDQEKLENFKKNFRSHNSITCTDNDLLNKNKANFTCFLKQRLEDLVRVCKQKARNIKGLSTDEFAVFVGDKQPPNDIEELLDNYERYGYRQLGASVFKNIKKKVKNQVGPVYLLNKVWYVCVPLKKKSLSLNDFTCNDYNPYDSLHNMNPEEAFEKFQEEEKSEEKYSEFKSFSDEDKYRIVKKFVNQNKNKPGFEEEIRAAKKLLRTLNVS